MNATVRRFIVAIPLAAAMVAGACAPGAPPSVAPEAPRYPDYVFPEVPADLAGADLVALHRSAWQALQAGDLRAAERGFADVLLRQPGFYPADVGLGAVDLARQAFQAALARFDAVVATQPGYGPALAGRGEALLGADRPEEALGAFEAALAADPSLNGLRRRVDVLRFRTQEALVAAARRAADRGQLEDARQDYERAIASSPDSPFLYRELADIERTLGRLDAALQHARQAVDLDPSDARSHLVLAEVQVARHAYDAALTSLGRATDLEPGDEALKRRVEQVRQMAIVAALPAEYGVISNAPAITRGDLAALIGVGLDPLLKRAPQREGVFITDTRGHWAAAWILAVARTGVMQVYPNYTFLPGATVHRGELATVVSRLLSMIAREEPAVGEPWRKAAVPFTDLPPGHLSYPAAALAVAAGVMPVLEGQTFQLSRVVSGAEAVAAITRLQELAGIAR